MSEEIEVAGASCQGESSSPAYPRIPSGTYRLQFHAGFRFEDAASLVDYLHDLGISDVYASPYFQAGAGSQHGYDVADHNRLNSEVGDAVDYRNYISALRQHGMGQILDFVPNHMGVAEPLNRWWAEVLEDGLSSQYARYFDIDWFPGKEALAEKLVLPVLGDRYGALLESGAFRVIYEAGALWVEIPGQKLPVRPATYSEVFQRITDLAADSQNRLEKLIVAFAETSEGGKVRAKQMLREAMDHDPAFAARLRIALEELAGEPGDRESHRDLHEFLDRQVYRLSYWRFAADEINYRRFFDINTLAAIRVEIPEVFEASHQFIFELLARGDVSGLRLDHVDGLWDPRQYLERLQAKYSAVCGLPADQTNLYVVVEKIVDFSEEQLPRDWTVHGTTGYEFANQIVHLLIDPSAKSALTRVYARYTGESDDFANLVYQKKRQVLELSFSSEVSSLARRLDELSETQWQYRDFSLHSLTSALQEVVAAFPVYRTYVTMGHKPDEQERRHINRAAALARRRNPSLDRSLFEFVRKILLHEWPEDLTEEDRERFLNFVMKFQQCTGPVMAKGLEDTSFYLFNRLIALNEVGGNPGAFGLALKEFHRLNRERQEQFPSTLLASSTHDTKRSEDVRLRIASLSEMPAKWSAAVGRWTRWNRKHRRAVSGEKAPSGNEEYFLYQTLVGSWPECAGDEEWTVYRERIQSYLLKAIKEGKVNSSWTEPNEEWEAAASEFVSLILDRQTNSRFVEDCGKLAAEAAFLGAVNSLTATVLKCTVPGVPDFYQGTELWDDSLVDPDNRRPVDYQKRREILQEVKTTPPAELFAQWRSGGIKCHFIRALLHLRRELPDFFRLADYQQLEVTGTFPDQVVAFRRSWNSMSLTVVAVRCSGKVGTPPLGEAWRDTALASSLGRGYDILSCRELRPGGALSDLLQTLPCAVILQK